MFQNCIHKCNMVVVSDVLFVIFVYQIHSNAHTLYWIIRFFSNSRLFFHNNHSQIQKIEKYDSLNDGYKENSFRFSYSQYFFFVKNLKNLITKLTLIKKMLFSIQFNSIRFERKKSKDSEIHWNNNNNKKKNRPGTIIRKIFFHL